MRGKLPPGQTRRFGREQGLLDKPSDAQLLLEALALLQLSLTLANEVKRPQRWRGLASQVLQQTAILHAVGRLAAAWPQAKGLITYVEQALPFPAGLDDTRYQRDLGPATPTALVDGVRRTLEEFARLHKDGRLDTRELAQAS